MVLWMIIVNVYILRVPMTVLFFGLNHGNARFARPAMIYNWIQLAGFCIQDLVICGIYIYEAIRALKCVIRIRGRNGRKVIIHLLWVNSGGGADCRLCRSCESLVSRILHFEMSLVRYRILYIA